MRIAIWHNLPSGGGARALNAHIKGLLSKGHHLEVWSQNPSADNFIELPEGIKVHHVPIERNAHVPYGSRVMSVFFQKDSNLQNMEKHCQTCASAINSGGFDVVFLNSCCYYAAPLISQLLTVPSAVYLGEPFRYFYEAQPFLPWHPPLEGGVRWLRRSYWQIFFRDLWKERLARVQLREERKSIDAIDTLLVNSIFSSESCARAYNRNGVVCYLGIDTTLFKPNKQTQKQPPYVVGVGNIFFHKNPKLAVEAISLIAENERPTLVWVANMKNDDYCNELTKLAAEKHVKLEIKEMISDEALVTLLSNAVCMIYTSKLEPFGLAPLEANACGTPVVAVAQGGVRETILDGQNGFLCNENPHEIAKKISFLLQNPDKQTQMGQTAFDNIQKNWTLESATNRLENALLNLVSK